MRHPSFQGLREDKSPREVTREVAAATPRRARRRRRVTGRRGRPIRRRAGPPWRGVRLTHPDRVFYPKPRVTKLDLARYYESDRGLDPSPPRATGPLRWCAAPTASRGSASTSATPDAGAPRARCGG